MPRMWDPKYDVEAVLRIIIIRRRVHIRIVGIREDMIVHELAQALATHNKLHVVINRSVNVTSWSDLVVVMPGFTAPVCTGGANTRNRIDWITVFGDRDVWRYRCVLSSNLRRE